jgi:hypothetical protein
VTRERRGASVLRRLVGAGAIVLVAGVPARGEIIDRIVAVVGDRPITLSDVRGALDLGLVDPDGPEDGMDAAIRALVERRLMIDEVDRYGQSEPDAALVDDRVTAVRARVGMTELSRIFARSGLDDARLRAAVRDTLRLEHYLAQRFGIVAHPSDDAVLAYYREHPQEFTEEGRLLSFREAEPLARQRAAARRRSQLVEEWVASLYRRADVQIVH